MLLKWFSVIFFKCQKGIVLRVSHEASAALNNADMIQYHYCYLVHWKTLEFLQ